MNIAALKGVVRPHVADDTAALLIKMSQKEDG